jgi:hypothetical protein
MNLPSALLSTGSSGRLLLEEPTMNRSSIGGAMTPQAYAALAQRHKPADPAHLAAEIHRMHDTGLTARDIATACRIPHDQVINVLGASSL